MAEGLNAERDAGQDRDAGQCAYEPDPPESLSSKAAPP
jgi:hypothetical protein